ncbi:MAG TPA: ATP-binding protein [Gemmatimonadaceae bacterium]|nr:ATP-binding protein [Gemmatimonadaceae bacterium]
MTAVAHGQDNTSRDPQQRRLAVDTSGVVAAAGDVQLPVAVLAPTGTDGTIAARVLGGAGFTVHVCENMDDACQLIRRGEAAVLIVAEEALGPTPREKLFDLLNDQPSWSDLPIILLTGEGELSGSLPRPLSGITLKGNVTLLERPVKVATLITLLRSAQRARQRQLDLRAYIEEREASENSLRESEERLRSAVLSAPYPLMLHAEDGEVLQLSNAWTALTGYSPHSLSTTGEWTRLALNDHGDADDPGIPAAEGESVHIGERDVRIADGSIRTWDFHRVALGCLPDGRRVCLTAAIDVTAYKELVESERTARHQAEDANSAKSQFLATMSHELRTPLNAIAGYTQLLTLGVRGPITSEQREDLERIDRSQRHLLSLINDILNFAKIEAGHVAIESKPVDLGGVFRGLQEFVEPQLREKHVNFSITNNAGDAVALGDTDKVRQILINLLSNAIKFTPAHGHISVECTAREGMVRIDVRDDGAGIPTDKLEAIFEPFVQVGRDFSSPQGGTGLGLSISRDLARRMKGDLRVSSKLGKGSTFSLTIPRM